ncbi:MAG TPA: peptide-N-glycosidase F-related protein [Polyangia bacterium]|nr:peptide-N-glycosidase F-related protein [Polyangia bacterium]
MARLLLLSLLVAGCSSNSNQQITDGGSDANACPAGAPMTIPIVSAAHLDAAHGSADAMIAVPAGCWSSAQVTMHVKTQCKGVPPPNQNWPAACDPFDRLAQVSLADANTTALFLLDAVTSFGGETTWTQDVTDYASLLAGTHDYHVEVGTYADPAGKATGTAASHDVDVSLTLTPGPPPRAILAAVPLLRQTIVNATPPLTAMITAPAGATHARLDYFTSGHGGNGQPPCDEFCLKENDLTLDGANVYMDQPLSDCDSNCTQVPISGTSTCGGMTFNYACKENPTACPSSAVAARSNWCPSRIIAPIAVTLPDSALTGTHSVGLAIQMVNGDWPIGLSAVFY